MQLPVLKKTFTAVSSALALPARAAQHLGRQSARIAFTVHQAAIRARRINAVLKDDGFIASSEFHLLASAGGHVNSPAWPELSRAWESRASTSLGPRPHSLSELDDADGVVRSPITNALASFAPPRASPVLATKRQDEFAHVPLSAPEPGCSAAVDSAIAVSPLLHPTDLFWAPDHFSWAEEVERELYGLNATPLAAVDKAFWALDHFSWAEEVEKELYNALPSELPLPDALLPIDDDSTATPRESFWAPAAPFSWAEEVETVLFAAPSVHSESPPPPSSADSFWASTSFSWAEDVEETFYGACQQRVEVIVDDPFWKPAVFSWADDVEAEFATRGSECVRVDSACAAAPAAQIDGALQRAYDVPAVLSASPLANAPPSTLGLDESFWKPEVFSWADDVEAMLTTRGTDCVGVESACAAASPEQIDGALQRPRDAPAVPPAFPLASAPPTIFGFRPSTLKGLKRAIPRPLPSFLLATLSPPPPPLPLDFSQQSTYAVDRALLDDIPGWLSSLRLRQYVRLFEGMRWEDMVRLDERGLEGLGVRAAKAKRKLQWVFEGVRQQEGVVLEEASGVGSGDGLEDRSEEESKAALEVGVGSGAGVADEEGHAGVERLEGSRLEKGKGKGKERARERESEQEAQPGRESSLGGLPELDPRLSSTLPPLPPSPPPLSLPTSTAVPRASAMVGAMPLISRRLHVATRAAAFRHAMPGLHHRVHNAATAAVSPVPASPALAPPVPFSVSSSSSTLPVVSASTLTSSSSAASAFPQAATMALMPRPSASTSTLPPASASTSTLAPATRTAALRAAAMRSAIPLLRRRVHVDAAAVPTSPAPAPPVPVPLAPSLPALAHPGSASGSSGRVTLESAGGPVDIFVSVPGRECAPVRGWVGSNGEVWVHFKLQ